MTAVAEKARKAYGDVPEGWERRRLRFDALLNPKKSSLDMAPGELVSFIPMDAVDEFGGLNLSETRELAEVYDGYTYFVDGDLCIAKITPCFENGKGSLAEKLTNGVGFGTTELHVVRVSETIDRRFLFYVSIAHDFRDIGASEMLGAAGQKRIPENFIKDWMPPLPPLGTQRRIARFLNEKTSQIDELIKNKRTLLDRLAEKRQASITRAVTKGLTEDKLCDVGGIPSGLSWKRLNLQVVSELDGISLDTRYDEQSDWAVYIPENWRNDWLKWSVQLSTERPTIDEQDSLPYISNEDITSWTGKLLTDEPQPSDSEGRKFRVDDVLFNKLRPYLAKVYHACFDGVSSGELLCLRPSEEVIPRFLFYVLTSKCFIDTIDAESFGAKMPRADWEIVGHLPLPLPSIDTQYQIVGFLDEKIAQIEELVEKISLSIELLYEYRSALITAAVTGQTQGLV